MAGGFAGRLDQVELLEQLGGPPPALRSAEVAQVRHEEQVLLAGEQVVDRRELAGDADRGAHRVGVPRAGRGPRRATSPPSAAISVDRICTVVVLPAPLGPSRAKIVPSATSQVDAVEHDLVAEGLAQPGDSDRVSRCRGGHGSSLPVSFGRERWMVMSP